MEFGKKLTILSVVILLALSCFSCASTSKTSTEKEEIELFDPLPQRSASINNPQVAWEYHWPEDYKFVLESLTQPCTDLDGNCYFIGMNNYIYSLDTNGKLRWSKKGFSTSLITTEEGIITKTNEELALLDYNGNEIWKKSEINVSDFYLAPNGILFCSTYHDNSFAAVNKNGDIIWKIPTNNYIPVQDVFFDTQSNAYFLLSLDPFEESMDQETQYQIVSLSPEGTIRWHKKLPHHRRHFIPEFLPNNPIQDTYLLAFTSEEILTTEEGRNTVIQRERESPKFIEAYNTNGEKMWDIVNTKPGLYKQKYAIDDENNFYITFNEQDYSSKAAPLINSYLTYVSNTGEKLWEKTLDSTIATCPTFDENLNLYLAIYAPDYLICSLTPDGEFRWEIEVDHANGCKFPVTVGSNQSIYFTTKYQSLLFCLKEAEIE